MFLDEDRDKLNYSEETEEEETKKTIEKKQQKKQLKGWENGL